MPTSYEFLSKLLEFSILNCLPDRAEESQKMMRVMPRMKDKLN